MFDGHLIKSSKTTNPDSAEHQNLVRSTSTARFRDDRGVVDSVGFPTWESVSAWRSATSRSSAKEGLAHLRSAARSEELIATGNAVMTWGGYVPVRGLSASKFREIIAADLPDRLRTRRLLRRSFLAQFSGFRA